MPHPHLTVQTGLLDRTQAELSANRSAWAWAIPLLPGS